LPQGQILQELIAARIKGSGRHYEQKPQPAQHRAASSDVTELATGTLRTLSLALISVAQKA
jgi:hypothetical protein